MVSETAILEDSESAVHLGNFCEKLRDRKSLEQNVRSFSFCVISTVKYPFALCFEGKYVHGMCIQYQFDEALDDALKNP